MLSYSSFRRHLFICLLTSYVLIQPFFTPYVKASTNELITLQSKISNASSNKKIDIILFLLEKYARFSPDLSLEYAEQALTLLQSQPNNKQKAYVFSYMATSHIYLGNLDQALEYLSKAFALSKNLADDFLFAHLYTVSAKLHIENNQEVNALHAHEQALSHAIKTEDDHLLASTYIQIGAFHRDTHQFEESLKAQYLALQYAQQLNDRELISATYGNIGSLYRTIGDYETALENQLKAVLIKEQIGDERELSITYNNTAIIYKDLGQYDKAIDMHKKSLALKEKLNYQRGMVFSYNNLGEAFRLAKNYEQSLAYLTKAKDLAEQLNLSSALSSTHLYLGRLYRDQGTVDLAQNYLNKALKYYQEVSAISRLSEAHLALGRLAILNAQESEAFYHLETSIKHAKEVNKNIVLLGAYDTLASYSESLEKYQQALGYYKQYTAYSDEIFSQQTHTRTAVLNIKYDVEKKQQQIDVLKQENKIAALELDNQQIQSRISQAILIVSFVALIIILFWVIKTRQYRRDRVAFEHLKTAQSRLKMALWGSGDQLWDWDLQSGILLRQNHLTNISLPSDAVGTSIDSLKTHVHPDDFSFLKQQFEKHLTCEDESYEASYRIKDKLGAWTWVLDRGKVVERDEHGKAIRSAGTLSDISELKQKELDLRNLNDELELRVEQRTSELKSSNEELQQAIDELQRLQTKMLEVEKMASLSGLVAGIAHEMNTPIGANVTAISIFKDNITQLKNTFENKALSKASLQRQIENFEEIALLIERNVKKTADLVSNFQKVSIEKPLSAPVTLTLGKFISEKIATMNNENIHSKPTTELEIIKEVTIQSYPLYLSLVIDELIENSITHAKTEENLSINIAINVDDEYAQILYEDSGAGIDSAISEDIFEPFTTTKRYDGQTGLGLHIVYNQVTQILKGSIELLPNPSGGAKFLIKLPNNYSI